MPDGGIGGGWHGAAITVASLAIGVGVGVGASGGLGVDTVAEVVNKDKILAAAEKRGRKLGPSQVEVCGCRINLV